MTVSKDKIKELAKIWNAPVKTDVCIFCGSQRIINKRSKNSVKGAYLGCRACASSCFLNSNEAVAGYSALSKLIKKFTPEYVKLLKVEMRNASESRMEQMENEILGIDV